MRYILLATTAIFIPFFAIAASSGDVVFNEVAWMGTKANSADEWIELKNTTGAAIDLSGWGIYEQGGTVLVVELSGSIASGGYYLIERTDDTTVEDVPADVSDPFGGSGLNNSGEHLALKDNAGNVTDQIDASAGWPAGVASPDYATMEKGTSGWHTNDGATRNGTDAKGNPVNGTPRAQNSAPQPPPPPPPQESAPPPTPAPSPAPQPAPPPPQESEPTPASPPPAEAPAPTSPPPAPLQEQATSQTPPPAPAPEEPVAASTSEPVPLPPPPAPSNAVVQSAPEPRPQAKKTSTAQRAQSPVASSTSPSISPETTPRTAATVATSSAALAKNAFPWNTYLLVLGIAALAFGGLTYLKRRDGSDTQKV